MCKQIDYTRVEYDSELKTYELNHRFDKKNV